MKRLMLGNAAAARGLYEAGCAVVSSYPGTPSTEISENLVQYKDSLYCEWSPNEKVATAAIPNCGITWIEAEEAKDLVAFTANIDLKQFGGEVPADEFYYAEK